MVGFSSATVPRLIGERYRDSLVESSMARLQGELIFSSSPSLASPIHEKHH